MSTKFRDDSLMLHTDLYQLNMMETYWRDGVHNRRAVFDLFFRKLPFGNGYAVFAGLEKIISYIENFGFTEDDIQYLREEGKFDEDFLAFLKELRFTGCIRAMQEGEIVFANEPLVRVDAPLVQAQLIETALLNIVNYQTLIATKASRIKQVVKNEIAMEFGSRRAHEMDAALCQRIVADEPLIIPQSVHHLITAEWNVGKSGRFGPGFVFGFLFRIFNYFDIIFRKTKITRGNQNVFAYISLSFSADGYGRP